MSQHHFTYTIGIPLPQGGELYEFAGEKSQLGSYQQPIARFVLTRPLVQPNPLSTAQKGTRFGKLIVRQYDRFGSLLRMVGYNDVQVVQLIDGPDLILEFTYKP